jgi:hypothetical protein
MTVLNVVKGERCGVEGICGDGERRSLFPFQRAEADKGMSECAKERTIMKDCLANDDDGKTAC